MLAFFRNDMGFGGNNGLTDFKDILGFDLQSNTTRVGLFLCTVLALIVSYGVCQYLTRSKAGRVLISIRDAESRTRFIGYRVEHFKIFVFVISALIAGVAGALYVPQIGIINPSEFNPLNSIEIVIWVAIGGRGTLYGAIIGAILVNYAKTYFTSGIFSEYWLFILGGLFVVTTIYLPKGVVGVVEQYQLRRDKKQAEQASSIANAEGKPVGENA
jgi:urea transport system permease protein